VPDTHHLRSVVPDTRHEIIYGAAHICVHTQMLYVDFNILSCVADVSILNIPLDIPFTTWMLDVDFIGFIGMADVSLWTKPLDIPF
jgi:hypothetical protein